MSELTDGVLGRYLDTEPGLRAATLRDPVEHAQVEMMRRCLEITERALFAEDVPEGVRLRIVNRIVWGEPTEPFMPRGERLVRMMTAQEPSPEVLADLLEQSGPPCTGRPAGM